MPQLTIQVPENLSAEELLARIPSGFLASFEADYRRLKEKNGIHTDPEELAFIAALMQQAEAGSFPLQGQEAHFTPLAAVAPTSAAAIRSRVGAGGGADKNAAKKNALRTGLIAVAAIVILLVLNAVLSNRGNKPNPNGTLPPGASVVVAGSPVTGVVLPPLVTMLPGTPLPPGVSGVPTPLPPATPPNVESIFDGQKVKVGIFYPQTLDMGGQVYFLVPTSVLPATGWPIPQTEGAASWLNGSSVNYVVGLPYSAHNVEVMGRLQVDDPLVIHMSTGQVLQFRVREIKRVPIQQVEIFRQKRPGITVALTGDPAADRLVVIGDYDAAAESAGGWTVQGSQPVPVWQAATAGDVGVNILHVTYYTPTNPAVQGFLPAGQVLYVLDYVLRNNGTGKVALTSLQAEAIDTSDLRYPAMEAVSKRYGRYPSLAESVAQELSAGQAVTLSAGYMVPETMVDGLVFVVSLSSGERALFDLTPEGLVPPPTAVPTATPTAVPSVAPTAVPTTPRPAFGVMVTGAVITDHLDGVTATNGLFLALSISVTNPTAGGLQIQWDDFVLTCQAGCSAGEPAQYPPSPVFQVEGQGANLLPLVIPGSGRVALLLVYTVGDVSAVNLHAGGQDFIISLK